MTLKPVQVLPGGDGVPPEPDWTTVYTDEDERAAARVEWGLVVREMREAGTLAVANGHAIKRLVQFRMQYERAARHVAQNGAILPAKRAKVGQWNPFWAVMKHADEAIRLLEAELGIAPVRRGKARKVEKRAKGARAADAYIGSTGK